jgi:signal transduction histidine kinase
LLSSTGLAEQVDEIRELLEKTIHCTRTLAFDLSPPVLYDLGLGSALGWLAEQIQQEHGIVIHLEDDNQTRTMSNEVRVILFRAVRELLMNIVKHAQARKATISIGRAGDNVRIRVEDDGVGFSGLKNDRTLAGIGGFGLFSIRERLEELGGQTEVESAPGQGTRVTLMASLSPSSEEERRRRRRRTP